MMTKKRIANEIRILKDKLKTIYKPIEKEIVLQQIRSLKVYGLMMLEEKDENNQAQYTDGTIMYQIKDVNEFYIRENGKVGIRQRFDIVALTSN